MPDTLRGRLSKLDHLKNLGEEFKVSLAEEELSTARAAVLKEFYRENPLAHAVAGGKDSYQTRIGFIEEKYSSFWKRIFAPKIDESFDQEVHRVLGSMNSVLETYLETYFEPEQFTTQGVRRFNRRRDRLYLATGGCFAMILGIFVYEPGIPDDVFGKLLPVIAFFVPYVVFKPSDNPLLKNDLQRLRTAAEGADEFLRQHYV